MNNQFLRKLKNTGVTVAKVYGTKAEVRALLVEAGYKTEETDQQIHKMKNGKYLAIIFKDNK